MQFSGSEKIGGRPSSGVRSARKAIYNILLDCLSFRRKLQDTLKPVNAVAGVNSSVTEVMNELDLRKDRLCYREFSGGGDEASRFPSSDPQVVDMVGNLDVGVAFYGRGISEKDS